MRRNTFVLVALLGLLSACDEKSKAIDNNSPPEKTSAATVAPEPKPEADLRVIGGDMMALSGAAETAIVKSGDAQKLRELLLWRGITNSSQYKSDPPLEGRYALARPEGKSFEIKYPLRIGLGRSRGYSAKLGALTMQEPSRACSNPCKNERINALILPITGTPLLSADGVSDSAALQKLLDAIAIQPADKVLGFEASELYPIIKPGVEITARVFLAMKTIGKDKILGEFAEAKKTQDKGLLGFYRAFASDHEIAEVAKVKAPKIYVTSGFWIRRMADGSDALLEKFMVDHLQKFDSKLHDELFGSAK